jgi:hypothetical protein
MQPNVFAGLRTFKLARCVSKARDRSARQMQQSVMYFHSEANQGRGRSKPAGQRYAPWNGSGTHRVTNPSATMLVKKSHCKPEMPTGRPS